MLVKACARQTTAWMLVQGKTQECAMDSSTVSKNMSNNINNASNKINITNKQQDTKCKADPLTVIAVCNICEVSIEG